MKAVDGNTEITDFDLGIAKELKKVDCPVILAINKVDLVKDEAKVKTVIDQYKKAYDFKGGITISAMLNHNVDKLIEMIVELLPNGPQYYPEDQLLDQPERFVVQELIREKVLLLTSKEVPHSVAVMVESFKTSKKNPNLVEIMATIIVERASQKKIIIGEKGSMIKKIGTMARADIVKFLGNKVYLELFVKVESDWRNKKSQLKEYGYKLDN